MSYVQQPYAPPPPSAHPTTSFATGAPGPTRNGLAITALVLSVIALFGVIGIVVVWVVTFIGGAMMMPGGDFMSDEYTLTGTAAQVVDGEPYPGDRLTVEVERVLDNDWSTHDGVECDDTVVVEAGAETSCSGVVDGLDTEMTVEFEDGEGHFTLIQHW